MKSSRLFQIVYELMSGERMTAPELARRLEVSVRTIYRDVEALCQAGIPIATGQGQGGGIRLMERRTAAKAGRAVPCSRHGLAVGRSGSLGPKRKAGYAL